MEEFDRRNEELCLNATEANRFANILGPINNNMGHILYVILAVIGAGDIEQIFHWLPGGENA